MRHNGEPRILASDLRPDLISLFEGERVTLTCPRCERWCLLRRGMVLPHKTADGARRCWGSGQRVTVDLTSQEWIAAKAAWLRQQTEAPLAATSTRRPTAVRRGGKAPVLPAVSQIAAARAA